jgi:hypothetical protein
VKRPDRFPRKSCDQSLMSACGLRWRCVTVKPVRSGVVESLPLATLGDFVRGRMGESERQVEGLFESLLVEVFA